jgi:hypothetical protein
LSYSVVTIFMTVCGGARASRFPPLGFLINQGVAIDLL